MPWDDDADDDAHGTRPPLPPDDRLWRHPSEIGQAVAAAARQQPPARQRTWPMALAAGLIGATLSAGAILAIGSFPERVVERPVVEKVALAPIVSSPMLRDEQGIVAIVERLSPAVARLQLEGDGGRTDGSAVIFRDDGLLLTSADLVANARSVTVVLTDGRRFDGELLGSDRLTDVAVIRIDGESLPVAVLGGSAPLEVGAATIAIGAPLGAGGSASVTTGVITALERRVDEPDGATLHGMIQVDGAIAPAASGGALVDASGAVIGITSAATSDLGSRFGFAVPIDIARRVAEELVTTGRVSHSWLGVRGTDLTGRALGGLDGGAMVRDVASGSPAAEAGLAPDDVITEVDGEEVGSISGLVLEMREREPGDEVVVGYWRDGHHEETTVVLEERP